MNTGESRCTVPKKRRSKSRSTTKVNVTSRFSLRRPKPKDSKCVILWRPRDANHFSSKIANELDKLTLPRLSRREELLKIT
jgi:hypothetical protein